MKSSPLGNNLENGGSNRQPPSKKPFKVRRKNALHKSVDYTENEGFEVASAENKKSCVYNSRKDTKRDKDKHRHDVQ